MLPSGQPQSRVCQALRKGIDRLPWGPLGSGCSWEEVSCLGGKRFRWPQDSRCEGGRKWHSGPGGLLKMAQKQET